MEHNDCRDGDDHTGDPAAFWDEDPDQAEKKGKKCLYPQFVLRSFILSYDSSVHDDLLFTRKLRRLLCTMHIARLNNKVETWNLH